MKEKSHNRQSVLTIISGVALIAMLLSLLWVEPQISSLSADDPLKAESTVFSSVGRQAVVFAESGRLSFGREILSKRSGSYERDNHRNTYGAIFSFSAVIAFVFFYLLSYYAAAILHSRRYIISYIHNLDGMKP